MKLFTIVESFGPADGARWTSYCDWRGIVFDRFDSIDGILRPNLFLPVEDEDWSHVVSGDSMIHFITDFEYAMEKRRALGQGEIVCVSFEEHDESSIDFLGYDLIDGSCDVSLLTNWGNDTASINQALSSSALVSSFAVIHRIRDELLTTSPNDGHVEGCRIVSIYAAKQNDHID